MIAWVHSTALLLALAEGGPLAASTSSARAHFPSRCFAIAPAAICGPSVQWLGPCVAGKAEGLGILRVGSRAPFAFLIGRMKAGRASSGHVVELNGSYMEAMAFDGRGEAILADGEHIPEQDKVWAEAVKAARSVAVRFAKAGNSSSAAYYRRFADEIEHGRPE